MLKANARGWIGVALVGLAVLGITIIFVPSTTSAGCDPGAFCLVRTNPARIWLTTIGVLVALCGVLGAWFAQRRRD